jgi:hypothetical protein
MVCHIFCSSLSHVGIAVFAFIPQVTFHASHRYCQPHARAVIHSLIAFHSTHFTFRVYVFSHPQIHVVAAVFRFTPHRFTTAHIHPFRSFASFHFIRSFLPALAFSNAPFGQKKCAKPAAGSTRPPRSALPVSGALAPLAAARTQRTGFILRSVSLHSHLPCYPRWLKAVFTIRFKPASPTPTPDHPPLRVLQLLFYMKSVNRESKVL